MIKTEKVAVCSNTIFHTYKDESGKLVTATYICLAMFMHGIFAQV